MKKFGLSADERIKSRKDFQQIFASGKSLISLDKKLKAVFIKETGSLNPEVKMAAAVSRKAGTAVWRNRFKRLIRESYRNNKYILIESAEKYQYNIKVVFSPFLLNQKQNSYIRQKDITPAVVELMSKIKSSL